MFLFGGRLLDGRKPSEEPAPTVDAGLMEAADTATVGHAEVFTQRRPLRPLKAFVSLAVFVGVAGNNMASRLIHEKIADKLAHP